MIVSCNKCDTSFNVDDRVIKKTGTKVRCSKCRHVFQVKPEESPAEMPASAAVAAGAGATDSLGDLDLDAIEKSLDLGLDESPTKGISAAEDSEDLDLDLNFDEDAAPQDNDVEHLATEDLDLVGLDLGDSTSLGEEGAGKVDLDFGLDLADTSDALEIEDDEAASEATAELDFNLDLDKEAVPESEEEDGVSDGTAELDFALDLGLDAEGPEADRPTAEAATSPDDLDFSLDLGSDDEPAAAAEQTAEPGGGDDFSLDPEKTSAAVLPEPGDDFDITQDLDVSAEDVLSGLEEQPAKEAVAAEAAEPDFMLDLDLEPEPPAASAEDRESPAAEPEFELDLDDEGPAGAAAKDAKAAMEETEELDLADLEDLIEVEGDGESEKVEETPGEVPRTDEAAAAEITDELDLSGLEDVLVSDDQPSEGTSASAAADAEPADVSALDDLLASATEDDTSETVSEKSAVAAQSTDEDEDIEFDLSDLDDLLEIEEEGTEGATEGEAAKDFDLELNGEREPASEIAEDEFGELEFEVEEDQSNTAERTAAAAGLSASADTGSDDGFGMGDLSELEGDFAKDDEVFAADEEFAAASAGKPGKKRIGGFFKFLILLVLLGGAGYGGYLVTDMFGIQIPYLDRLKEINIPYVSELFGTKTNDPGYLKITILEPELDGKFVQNDSLGPLFVVSGKVKNAYSEPRSFIRITGKLYDKGHKNKLEETVYAGNLLSPEELAELEKEGLDRKLGNRQGQDRTNLNVKTGATVPFMIVFANLPQDPDEYTVEVAGSMKGAKK
jgi:predicted Zn finger-like uncharacterized protein